MWLDAGYTGEGKGADWVQKVLGWTVQIVRHPPKLVPEEVMRVWLREWAKDGVAIDPEKLSELRAAEVRRSASAVGGGANLFLAGAKQADEQGLRKAG